MDETHWQVWADTGGTFTDCVAVDPQGALHRTKVLSSSALRARVEERAGGRRLRLAGRWELPSDFLVGARLGVLGEGGEEVEVVASEETTIELAERAPDGFNEGSWCELRAAVPAPVLATHVVTRVPLAAALPPLVMRLATTRGTNALLERRGAPTALFITRGFGDLVAIGTQQRPELFALDVVPRRPLYAAVVEVEERLAADGTILVPLRLGPALEEAKRLLAAGVRCAAVALMHAYLEPAHELELAAALRRAGFGHVSLSSELAPLIGLLARAETAVVDAYLTPIVGRYLGEVEASVGGGRVHVMTSAGGLVAAARYAAKDSLLSGPAGGVVGAAQAARASRVAPIVAFDMGGTSTDVARWDGDYEYRFAHRIGDAELMAPALAIESVAAGGGSICHCRAGQLRVGPESAGAEPGPACYGAGGPLTLTDVNLLLGRIVPERFGIPLSAEASRRELARLVTELRASSADPGGEEGLLEGLLAIANERMAAAIRRISVRRGYDPTRHLLVAFGGAGPQHACAVAALLGIATVVVPAEASLLSALGLGQAVVERFAQRQLLRPLSDCLGEVATCLDELEDEARGAVVAEGAAAATVVVRRRLASLRLAGQNAALTVEVGTVDGLAAAFAEAYRALYGYDPPRRPVELESLRVVASTVAPPPLRGSTVAEPAAGFGGGDREVYIGGRWMTVPAFERGALAVGDRAEGPALVVERHSVTVVEPGWRVALDEARALVLERSGGERRRWA